jgi:NAD(P)H-dependent FMN reductase
MTTIVAISGSLRARSSNAALLRAAASVAPAGVEFVFYEGMGDLPHFNPDLDAEGSTPPEPVRRLRELLIRADAILISSPEYAHGVPGSFKNLLDWLVSTGELVGKPVALLNAAPAGCEYAQSAILETLRTMNWNVVAEACCIRPFVKRRGALDTAALETLGRVVRTLVTGGNDDMDVLFAPALVAHMPQSMTLEIGEATMTFTDVDLNVWFADALEAIDASDRERVIAAKRSLASSIAASLVPVGEDDDTACAVAATALEAALLEKLALATNAVVAVSGEPPFARIVESDAPLRVLPRPPVIVSQTAGPSKRPHDDPSVLALWDYSFTYDSPDVPTDTVIARVDLASAPKALRDGDDERLFRALARFETTRSEVDDETFEEIAAAYAARLPQKGVSAKEDVPITSAEGLNILEMRSAQAFVQTVRNAESAAFRVVSVPVTATMSAPRLSHQAFDLATLSATTLDGYLAAFFGALLGQAQVTVRVACAYRYDGAQLPVALMTHTELQEGWTTQLAEVITEWYASQQPPSGTFTFDVTVSDDGAALIEIRDLHIASDRVMQSGGEAPPLH